MRHNGRKRVWIDPFQTRLALRVGAYLAMLLFVLVAFLLAWKLAVEGVGNPLEQGLGMLRDYLPVGVCLLILAPVMVWDAVRFAHRLVGPLVRFRRAMQSVARGEAVSPIQLREGDYLNDLRDDFNQMLEALQRRGVPTLKPDLPAEDPQAQTKPA